VTDWWNQLSLNELNQQQWEALCDGCARCCLHKLEDEETGDLYYTRVRCQYLDEQNCRCSDYANRSVLVPLCIKLDPQNSGALEWMPQTCAYRLRANNQPLPEWHPLVSGSPDSVHEAGISVRGRAISEEFVHPDGYDEYIVHWVDEES
jgi:uncharacterized protein